MGSPTLKLLGRMVREGQPNEVTHERLQKLVESGLWDVVVDASDYGALLADIRRGDDSTFRLTDDEVAIHMPALKRPTLTHVRESWNYVDRIESDHSTEEAVTLRLSTVLKTIEKRIDGATYERRLMKLRTDGKLLGFQHRQWLIANQDNEEAIPDVKVRLALKALLGKVYIDFPGIIVIDQDGSRYITCVDDGGEQWIGDWYWLGSDFHGSGRVAVCSK